MCTHAPFGGFRARTRPAPNPADADDARPLAASATHSKNWQFLASRHRAGCGRPSAHDSAGLPGIVHGGPETPGRETRAHSEKPPGEVPCGPMERRGSDEAGSVAFGVVAFCFAFSYRARLGQAENKKGR